jgi:hypothetical protein
MQKKKEFSIGKDIEIVDRINQTKDLCSERARVRKLKTTTTSTVREPSQQRLPQQVYLLILGSTHIKKRKEELFDGRLNSLRLIF